MNGIWKLKIRIIRKKSLKKQYSNEYDRVKSKGMQRKVIEMIKGE